MSNRAFIILFLVFLAVMYFTGGCDDMALRGRM